jgi:hypothetical protein
LKTRATEAAAILSNFERIMAATDTAYKSNGSAARENQKVLESLNGSIQKLKAEWESLVNDKSTQDTLQFLVDLTTNIVKLVKALGGLKTIIILLIGRFVVAKVAALGLAVVTEACGEAWAKSMTKGELFAFGLKRIGNAATETATKLGMTTASLVGVTAAFAVVAVAIAGLVAYVNYLSEAWERNNEAYENALQEYQEGIQTLSDLEDELENNREALFKVQGQIAEINSQPLDYTREQTLKDLTAQEEQLKRNGIQIQTNINLQKQYNKLSEEKTRLEAKASFTGEGKYSQRELEERGVNTGSIWSKEAFYGSLATSFLPGIGQILSLIGIGAEVGANNSRYGSEQWQISKEIQTYDELKTALADLTEQQKQLNQEYEIGNITQDEYNKKTKELQKETEEYNKKITLVDSDLMEAKDKLEGYLSVFEETSDEYKMAKLLLDYLSNTLAKYNDQMDEATIALENLKRVQNQYKDSANALYNSLDDLNSTYSDLTSAVDEYNQNGKLSITTLAKLMEKYPGYLSILEKEGFSEEVVTKAIKEKIQAQINEMQTNANATLQTTLGAQANIEAAKAALKNAEAQNLLTQAYFNLPEGVQGPLAPNKYAEGIKSYLAMQEEIDKLQASLDNTTVFGSTTKKSAGSSKKETDKWKEAFNKAYDDLKHRRSLDLIDTKQYIEELTALNDKYFKDRVEYETEYNKYVEELYKERQNLFKEQLNDLRFQFEMLENQGANKQTLILKYKEIQDALHQQAEYYRSLNLEENNDLIQDLQSQWWDYQKKIKELEQGIADEIEKQNKEIKEQMDKELDLLDERFEALRDYAVDMIDKEIELKEQALQKQNDLLDEQIEKYKEEEDNLENQKDIEDKLLKIEEARKKLAEAKNQKVRVYRAGKGFVYESDFNAVSQAQKQLDELLKEWNLFQEKAKIANIIAELEAEKEANEKRVNAEIADLNTLKDAWDKSLDISKDVENYKGWLTKIENSEKLSFNQRLAQVKTFVTAYNNEMALIKSNYPTTDEVSAVVSKDSNKNVITTGKSYGGVTYYPDVDYQALINNTLANAPETEKASLLKDYETKRNAKIAGEGSSQAQTSLYGGTTFSTSSSSSSRSSSGSSSGSSRSSSSSSSSKSSSSSSSSSSTTMSQNDQTKIAIAKEAYNTAKAKGDTAGMAAAHAVAESVRASYGYSGGGDGSQHIGLASGTNNADGNIHLVGEEGPELFIPPSGSGIIPNPKTNNLMQWGTINPASLLAAISQGQGTVIEVDNITLPNVRDAESFVEELKNFKNYAIQKQSIRK